VKAFAATGRPLLGICLGMELLLDESSEFGRHAGTRPHPGGASIASRRPRPASREKIPNVGWCPLEEPRQGATWSGTILADVKVGDFVYFVHSYAAYPADPGHRLADITFAGIGVTAAVGARERDGLSVPSREERSRSALRCSAPSSATPSGADL